MSDHSTPRVRPPWNQGLLVSVRNAEEAGIAAAAGASIVDIKEPLHGPLGRAGAAITTDAILAVGSNATVTLACGELADAPAVIPRHVHAVLACLPASAVWPTAVKAGPARLTVAEWLVSFRRLGDMLPESIEVVAVAYADWREASAPTPEAILTAAAEAGARTVLVDTFDKSGPGLFGVVSPDQVAAWVAQARARGLAIAIAGQLKPADMVLAFALGVDVAGVRSAACEGGRLGRIDPTRVQALGRLVPCRLNAVAPALEGESIS